MKHRAWWMISMAAIALATGGGGQTPSRVGEAQDQPPAAPTTGNRDNTSLPALAPSDVPPGIVWGPGRDVQAGLVLASRFGRPDQHTGLNVFSVYLRNRTRRTLNITCPSFLGLTVPRDDTDYTPEVQSPLIYCTPHLRDGNGKPVDMSYKLGAEENQYAVGPGQVVSISHWMLRTMERGAKGSSKTKEYTLVAFVAPGKYRVSCDVNDSWGGKGSRHTKLRTGEVAFEVTGADLTGL